MNTHLACADSCDVLAGCPWPTENNMEHTQYSGAYEELVTSSIPAVSWLNFDHPFPADEHELLSPPAASPKAGGLQHSWAEAATAAGLEHLSVHSDGNAWADAGAASMDSASGDIDVAVLSNTWIQSKLQAEATPESCARIRAIAVQLRALEEEGMVQMHVAAAAEDNSVWGFNSLTVSDPLRFNQAFRAIAAQYARPFKSNKPLRKPAEVFMKTLRFCGVTARRGTRGPAATDPDPRDFLYSHFYDFVPGKENYNRRKLCPCGYSKEARESAGKRKGEFIQTFAKRKNLSRLPDTASHVF